ncbi:MAG: HcpC [Cryobacterium sp.]|nr:HcpC [Micrococcales bacterium]MBX3079856.1 HcpC [Cryobacterium sp.]
MSHTRTLRSPKAILTGALLVPTLILALSGCVGAQPSASVPTESSGSEQPAPVADNVVTTIGLKFMPKDLTVKVGTTVTWQNGEAIGHTVTSGAWGEVNEATGVRGTQTPDGRFDHALAPKGQEGDTFSFTFTEPGVYPYYCKPHLTMNATVTVEP